MPEYTLATVVAVVVVILIELLLADDPPQTAEAMELERYNR